MKELTCFAVGLLIGALLMKKSQTVEDLRKELERERWRSNPRESA